MENEPPIRFEVEAIGSDHSTRVGASTGAADILLPDRPLRISLAGLGVVGQALAARLKDEPRFEIVSILVHRPKLGRAVPPPCQPTSDLRQFLSVETDIIVDAQSCEQTGTALYSKALPKDLHVVGASKRAISAGHRLFAKAPRKRGRICSIRRRSGGAIVFETVDLAYSQGPVRTVAGILNGTVNYVLDGLTRSLSLDEALVQARFGRG